jgi:hypothetical protein
MGCAAFSLNQRKMVDVLRPGNIIIPLPEDQVSRRMFKAKHTAEAARTGAYPAEAKRGKKAR